MAKTSTYDQCKREQSLIYIGAQINDIHVWFKVLTQTYLPPLIVCTCGLFNIFLFVKSDPKLQLSLGLRMRSTIVIIIGFVD